MCKREYTVEENKLMLQVRQEGQQCYYCKTTLGKKNRSVDHLIPYSRGGKTVRENLVVCCTNCNQEKDNLTADEYIEFLNRLKDYYENDDVIQYLKSMIVTHQRIVDKNRDTRKKLGQSHNDRDDILYLIETSTVNAAEMYMLGRDLRETLKKIRNEKIQLEKLSKIEVEAKKSLEKTQLDLEELKQKLRICYIKEFKSEKKIS